MDQLQQQISGNMLDVLGSKHFCVSMAGICVELTQDMVCFI